MTQRPSNFSPPAKRPAPSNPMILSSRATFWVFWVMAAVMAVLIVGATCWLLTHPLAA